MRSRGGARWVRSPLVVGRRAAHPRRTGPPCPHWEEAVDGSFRSDYPHDGYHRGDLLASIAPPLHQLGGVDMLVSKAADGGRGVTLLLQNPYGSPLVVQVTIHRDVIQASLSPLEVAILTIPVVHRGAGSEIGLSVSSGNAAGPRLREAGASKVDLPHSALGILGGLATLALTPVGHFSVTRQGGDVPNPFTAKLELQSRVTPTPLARYERQWAPADAGPQTVGLVKRDAATSHELTAAGYVVAFIVAMMSAGMAAGMADMAGLNTRDTGSDAMPLPIAVVFLAIMIGVGVAVAAGLDRARAPILTRRPVSALPMLGPGLREAMAPASSATGEGTTTSARQPERGPGALDSIPIAGWVLLAIIVFLVVLLGGLALTGLL